VGFCKSPSLRLERKKRPEGTRSVPFLAFVLRDYSYTSAFDTFVYHEKSNRDIRNDLAALVGVRFLSAEEDGFGSFA
jgi:hypothetical protein